MGGNVCVFFDPEPCFLTTASFLQERCAAYVINMVLSAFISKFQCLHRERVD